MKLLNPLVIIRILSSILFIETISFLLCLPIAHFYGESPFPFLWSAFITIVLSVILFLISKNTRFEKPNNREGIMAVTLSWIIFTALGTLPYLLSGTITSFVNAFFESVSGFTTTGSTILKDVEILPHSILFWRSFTTWVGGLGIIVVVVLIMPALGVSGGQMLTLESSLKEKILPKTKAIGYRLLYLYLGLTVVSVFFLSIGDLNLFDSICYSFGTISTGGFSNSNAGLIGHSAYTQYVIAIFMFLSGISFVAYYFLLKLNFRKVIHNEELWFYIGATIILSAIATFILLSNTSKPIEEAFRIGFFHVLSILTTTGYVTEDYLYWPHAGLVLIFILLFTGASTGTTTGGIKMSRHLIVLKNIKNTITHLIHPNVISQIKLNGKPVSEKLNITVLSFVVLYIMIFIAGTVIIVSIGTDPVTAASAVAASLSNTGSGLGSIGPAYNYANMPDASKVIYSLLMIIGRLEIFPVFILFSKSYWKS